MVTGVNSVPLDAAEVTIGAADREGRTAGGVCTGGLALPQGVIVEESEVAEGDVDVGKLNDIREVIAWNVTKACSIAAIKYTHRRGR